MQGNTLQTQMHDDAAAVRKNGGWLMVGGVALIALGACALYYSVATTIASIFYLGILVIAGGIFVLIDAFSAEGWKARLGQFLIAALYLISGIVIVAYPGASAVWFTIFVAAFLLVSGVVRIFMAFQLRQVVTGWVWTLIGGIASILLGLMIFAQWPVSGLWVIGMFVAIEMIMHGISMLTIGMAARVVAK